MSGVVSAVARDVDADGLMEQQLGERLHGRRKGCGEQQVLATVGQQRQHASELVGETSSRDDPPRRAPGCSPQTRRTAL